MATEGHDLSQYDADQLPDTSGMRFGIVVSEWNHEITSALAQGARQTLIDQGTPEQQISLIQVPGSYELIYGARVLCEKNLYDAVIAVGCIVQGETRHFEFIAQAVSQGIAQLNVRYDTPVIFGVLTDDNIEQSRARSGGEHGNKGVECAVAAIKLASLRRILQA